MGNFFKNRGRVLALFGVVGFVAGVGAYYATQRTIQAQTATTESGCKVALKAGTSLAPDYPLATYTAIYVVNEQSYSSINQDKSKIRTAEHVLELKVPDTNEHPVAQSQVLYAVALHQKTAGGEPYFIASKPFTCRGGKAFTLYTKSEMGGISVESSTSTGTSDTSGGRTTGTNDTDTAGGASTQATTGETKVTVKVTRDNDVGISGAKVKLSFIPDDGQNKDREHRTDQNGEYAYGWGAGSLSSSVDASISISDILSYYFGTNSPSTPSEKSIIINPGTSQTVTFNYNTSSGKWETASAGGETTEAPQPAIGTDEVGATGLGGFVIPGAGGSNNTEFWGNNTLTLRAVRYTREGGESGTDYVPVGGVRYEIEVIKPGQGVETSTQTIQQQQPSWWQKMTGGVEKAMNSVGDAYSKVINKSSRVDPSRSPSGVAHAQSTAKCYQLTNGSYYLSEVGRPHDDSAKEVALSNCPAASSTDEARSDLTSIASDLLPSHPSKPSKPADWESNVWPASQVNRGGLRRAVNGETASISGVIPDNGLSSKVRIANLPNGYYRITVSKSNFKTTKWDIALTSNEAADLPIAPSPGAEAPANGFAGVPTQYPGVSNKSILYVGGLEPEALVYDTQIPWYGWQRASSYITTRPTYDLTPGIPDYVPPLNVETMSGWNMGGIFGGIGSCDYLLSTFGSGADPVAAGLSAFLLRFKGEKHNNLGEGLLQGLGAYAIAKLFNSDGQTINIDQLYNYCIARNTNVLNNMPSACWPCLVSQSTQTCPYECRMYVTQYAPSYMQF